MAFLTNSRYDGLPTVEAETESGRTVLALTLRRLPKPEAETHVVADEERLDLLALTRYRDGTKGWHVADANTALEARELTATPGRVLELPKE